MTFSGRPSIFRFCKELIKKNDLPMGFQYSGIRNMITLEMLQQVKFITRGKLFDPGGTSFWKG
jgi:hypothetical protein